MEDKIIQMLEQMNEKFNKMEQRFDKMEQIMNERFDEVDNRFTQLDTKVDKLETKIVSEIKAVAETVADNMDRLDTLEMATFENYKEIIKIKKTLRKGQ